MLLKPSFFAIAAATVVMANVLFVSDKGLDNNSDIKINGSYLEMWQQADSLESEGLPKSALAVVEKIYEKAKKENNIDHLIRALVYQLKYLSYFEEDARFLMVDRMKTEISETGFPANAVMHSMLAELYQRLFEQERWTILQRGNTNLENQEIKNWSLKDYVMHIAAHFDTSLVSPVGLQKLSIDKYQQFVGKGNFTDNLRPSLYDFLIYRALDYYSSTETMLTRPVDYFNLSEDWFFNPASEFSKHAFATTDTFSSEYRVVKYYQQLLKFRIGNNNPNALLDADRKRLEYFYNHSSNMQKDSLYIRNLRLLMSKYKSETLVSEVHYSYGELIRSFYQVSDPESKKNLPKALKVFKDIVQKFPGSIAAKKAQNAINQLSTGEFSIEAPMVEIPGNPFAVKVFYRVDSILFLRVYKIKPTGFSNPEEDDYNYNQKEYLVSKMKSGEVVYTKQFGLPQAFDLVQHSAEIILPGFEKGHYIIHVSQNEKPDFESGLQVFASFQLTTLSAIVFENPGKSPELYVVHRESGHPLPGVGLQMWEHKYNYRTRKQEVKMGQSLLCDQQGKATLPLTSNDARYSVELKLNNDSYILKQQFWAHGKRWEDESVRHQAHLFTDRGIYRPGQTVYCKGLLTRRHKDSIWVSADKDLTVQFKNANYENISEARLKTDRFGSFHTSFVIPSNVLTGNMQIVTPYGNVSIKVEEYKRPNFEFSFVPMAQVVKINDTIQMEGKANSFSGAALSGAKVKYSITRKFYHSWFRWYFLPENEAVITTGQTTCGQDGIFRFHFVALPDLSLPNYWEHSFVYTLMVDVTDQNGETHANSETYHIGPSAFAVSCSLGEKENIKNVEEIKLKAVNFLGVDVQVAGVIKIYRLKAPDKVLREKPWLNPDQYIYSKEEWDSLYPGNVYKDENNPSKWKIENMVWEQSFRLPENANLKINARKFEPGTYRIMVQAVSEKGDTAKLVSEHYFYSENDKSLPSAFAKWDIGFNKEYVPGEIARYRIGSSYENVKALYILSGKDKVLESKWIDLSANQHTLEFPILKHHRGNLGFDCVWVVNNICYSVHETIVVPFNNKKIDVEYLTFRDKLKPGQPEEWVFTFKNAAGKVPDAQLTLAMYDASLDQIWSFSWNLNLYFSNSFQNRLRFCDAGVQQGQIFDFRPNNWIEVPEFYYPSFNWYGFYGGSYYPYEKSAGRRMTVTASSGFVESDLKMMAVPEAANENNLQEAVATSLKPEARETKKDVFIRKNFNETAFFFPDILPGKDGKWTARFTMPDALTRWKLMGLVHTPGLDYGTFTREVVSAKDLMLTPNLPRFFREGDAFTLKVKLANTSNQNLKGKAKLWFTNAITGLAQENILADSMVKFFEVSLGSSGLVEWKLKIPDDCPPLIYHLEANTGQFTDAEQGPVLVLPNRMRVTETLPLPIRGKTSKQFVFKKLLEQNSSTLEHKNLTVEFSSNPAWYALLALPYLMESKYECADEIFNRFYSNFLASNILKSNPAFEEMFRQWKMKPNANALTSNLETNQELKTLMLNETPWLNEGLDETTQKQQLAVLFDQNRMQYEMEKSVDELLKMQFPGGAWPWFNGMYESRYITMSILCGVGRLMHLKGIEFNQDQLKNAALEGLGYLDDRFYEDYIRLQKRLKPFEMQEYKPDYSEVYYLYTRSFYEKDFSDKTRQASDFLMQQSENYWLTYPEYAQAMLGLIFNRAGNRQLAMKIIASLRERAIVSEEMGMYWRNVVQGWNWYQAKVETQACLIRLFDEVLSDTLAVDDMKTWLLKNKQTNRWHSSRATVEAVHALVFSGNSWFFRQPGVKIEMGNTLLDPVAQPYLIAEAGTGYFKKSFQAARIIPEMANITVTKSNDGPAWGAVYWQYEEDMQKITEAQSPLQIKRKIFIEKKTGQGKELVLVDGKNTPKIGDKLIVRVEITTDRDLEYVHLKDSRAAALEPIEQISGYRWKGGLGYYQSMKDASADFFFSYLPKGSYVFEYPLRASQKGVFSNGISTIQCYYAPEFAGHSEGLLLEVLEY